MGTQLINGTKYETFRDTPSSYLTQKVEINGILFSCIFMYIFNSRLKAIVIVNIHGSNHMDYPY